MHSVAASLLVRNCGSNNPHMLFISYLNVQIQVLQVIFATPYLILGVMNLAFVSKSVIVNSQLVLLSKLINAAQQIFTHLCF